MKQQLPPLGVWFGKAPSIALCILGAIALTAPAIVHLSGNNTDTSQLDNRRPAPFPALPNAVDAENFDRLWLLRKRLATGALDFASQFSWDATARGTLAILAAEALRRR